MCYRVPKPVLWRISSAGHNASPPPKAQAWSPRRAAHLPLREKPKVQRKEVRIALGVVASLLVVFAGALVWRFGFAGTPEEDAIAAAPAAPKDGAPRPDAGTQESRAAAQEPPTVLTATKSSTANSKAAGQQAPATPAESDRSWSGDYAGPSASHDETRQPASQAPVAETDPWGGYAGRPDDALAEADTDPYGYGDEGPPHDDAEATPRGTRNQLRESAAATVGNPLRGPANRPAAEPGEPGQDAPSPNLSEQPDVGEAAATGRQDSPAADPFGSAGWSYSSEPVEDETETAADVPAGKATGAVATAEDIVPAAKRESSPPARGPTPRLLSETPAPPRQSAASRAAPAQSSSVVTTSAEADPADAPEPEPPAEGTYRVAARDTYWRIARSVYGDPAYYRALYEHNRARYPRADRLPPGTVLETPELAALERLYPQFCPASTAQ
jgi:LysM repeat protein